MPTQADTPPILITDDDADALDGLMEFLTSAGFRLVSARDGQAAMESAGGLVPILLTKRESTVARESADFCGGGGALVQPTAM